MGKAYALVIVLLAAILVIAAYQVGLFGSLMKMGPGGTEETPFEGTCNLPSAPTL